jgi:beta-RFAP synthase
LRLTRAERLQASGPLAERAMEFARRWTASAGRIELPRCHIEILHAPPLNAGLGVGTQLGLAVAAGLNAMHGRARGNAVALAAEVERGLRSSVGIYGFELGGLIVERGKLAHEAIAPLAVREEVPCDWRVVLIQPHERGGLSGGEEQQAFAAVAPVPDAVTAMLWQEVEMSLLPALRSRDCDAFSQSVYRFGHAAGMCFAAVQGGAYNGSLLTEIVAAARRLGVEGVGQSSWGPTIFCLLRDDAAASEFIQRMRRDFPHIEANYTIAGPVNHGATIATPGTTASEIE